jgi:uracil-DNA glycosylase family 4
MTRCERDRDRAFEVLRDEVVSCRRCPRLVAWREEVARTKRAAFTDESYWGRPLPGYGDPSARVLLVGLAPAAHGGNRTGRVFTGDRSGDWLFASLWRTGFASQPESRAADDGLVLRDAYVTAAVRCAPPENKPSTAERDACRPFLARELALLDELRVVVALGRFAHDVVARELAVTPRPEFAHGSAVTASDGTVLLGSYHPSQRNTFTGLLTEPMLDALLLRARHLAHLATPPLEVAVTPDS